jgi:hypothetical protein
MFSLQSYLRGGRAARKKNDKKKTKKTECHFLKIFAQLLSVASKQWKTCIFLHHVQCDSFLLMNAGRKKNKQKQTHPFDTNRTLNIIVSRFFPIPLSFFLFLGGRLF